MENAATQGLNQNVKAAIGPWRERGSMVGKGLPGCMTPKHRRPAIGDSLEPTQLKEIGNMTICTLDKNGQPVAMREGLVVTWPQLFLLGANSNLSAMELFSVGYNLQRLLTMREPRAPRNEHDAT